MRLYVEKYHKEVIQMGVFDEKETLANFKRNLWAGRLFCSFAKHPPETYQEAYNRALEQVDIEEQLRIKVEHDEARMVHRPRKEAPKLPPARRFQNPPPNRSTYRPPPIPPYQKRYPARRTPLRVAPQLKEVARIVGDDDAYNHYTPLNASQEAIYLAIRDKGLLRKHDPMKAQADGRNRFKYCDFHEDVGHNTSE